jgi:hypothetical protein
MVEGMTERWDHTSATRNQDSSNASQLLKVEMFLSFLVLLLVGHFSYRFVLTVFLRQIPLHPQTQDVRIGKAIHCYPVRMRNPPSVV